MSKEIEIGGCIEVPNEITIDEVTDAFIEFSESKGWYFYIVTTHLLRIENYLESKKRDLCTFYICTSPFS